MTWWGPLQQPFIHRWLKKKDSYEFQMTKKLASLNGGYDHQNQVEI